MTEKEKRDRSLWYDAAHDARLIAERKAAEELCRSLNDMPAGSERESLLEELLGGVGAQTEVLSPLCVDYGYNVSIGTGSFINHGAYLMDCAKIIIGDRVFIGPSLGAYTAQHPILAQERNTGLERALPIVIGDDVWIGGNVTLCPGVRIGRGSVIGAGSVVTRDVPSDVVAVGNPCRVLRRIDSGDSIGRQAP